MRRYANSSKLYKSNSMHTFLIYIIKWAIALAILYAPFTLLMRKETFASFNRALLLCTLSGSLLLPLAEVKIPIEAGAYTQNLVLETASHIITTTATNSNTKEEKSLDPWQILYIIYIAGASISAIKLLINIIITGRTIRRGTLWREQRAGYTLHCHAHPITPFSWFGNIVISQDDYNNYRTEIILHEEGHIKGRHSWDILIVSLLTPLQWFNPFIYMLTNELKDIHEYSADRYALQRGNDARSYQLLILKKAIGEQKFTLVNNFAHSSVRKRVEMMIRQKSGPGRLLKSLYTLPTAIIVILLFSEPEYIYSSPPAAIGQQETHKEKTRQPLPEPQKADSATTKAIKTTQKTDSATEATKKVTTLKAEPPCDTLPPVKEPSTESTSDPRPTRTTTEYYATSIALDEQQKEPQNWKCSLIIEFDLGGEGKISNIETKTCNLSIEQESDTPISTLLPRLREQSIQQATAHIQSREWHPRTAEGTTHYIANITMHTGKASNSPTPRPDEIMWIGTTPIK